jgi:hypothetical protein
MISRAFTCFGFRPAGWYGGLWVVCLVTALSGCVHGKQAARDEPLAPRVSTEEAVRLVPPNVKEREGWADDVLAALVAHHLHPSLENVCAVLAVIEQESGFQANPAVPGLARIVEQRLEAYANKLGPFGPPALEALLGGRAPGEKRTFAQRMELVRTERDLDRIFRELLEYYEKEFPSTYTAARLAQALFQSGRLEDLNPITTAGSMQVSVRFSEELAGNEEGEDTGRRVREQLYTRAGGVYYGTARLLGYEAHYTSPLHRFADYNAGFYTSRNAALQEQVGRLTGIELTLDGDLLAYDKQGEPLDTDSNSLQALLEFRRRHAPELSERRVRKDALQEKTLAFEETDTWLAIKRAYQEVTGRAPDYARLPTVVIRSPKLSGERSTAWFAQSVNKRFERCLGRATPATR